MPDFEVISIVKHRLNYKHTRKQSLLSHLSVSIPKA